MRDVAITCTAPSHDKVLTLHTFEWNDGAAGHHFPNIAPKGWQEVMTDDVRPGGNEIRSRRHIAGVSLDAADRVEAGWDGPMGRERYKLQCLVCGDSVTVRHENLEPILSRLAEVGESSLPLSVLRAILLK